MIVQVNGQSENIEDGLTILSFIKQKGLVNDYIVVEHNGEIIPKEKWETVKLSCADKIEIVRFVGGG